MALFQNIVTYFFLFATMYVEIFMLTVFIAKRREIKREKEQNSEVLKNYPTVSITVPCFNEEKTVGKTIESLATLDYPKDKLKVLVIDDGSTDKTWEVIQEYSKKYPNFEAIHKENGGKYTALNIGIERSTSEYIGCLDADSFVDPKSLKKIMKRFEEDTDVMAVTPALRIHNPRAIVQLVQSAEYHLAVLAKKIQAFLGAIHVTPGPFTIFKRSVFEKIGPFKRAHNLEDMEMASRMQKNQMKIDNVHHAWVFTTGPDTLKKLYKQRLRWTHGFIENARDYKDMFFNPRYGNVSFLTLPSAFLFIIAVVFSLFFILVRVFGYIVRKIIQWKTVGFVYSAPTFGWFYLSARVSIILSIIVFLLTLLLYVNAQLMVEGNVRPKKNVFLFFVLYPLISPFWVAKSIYNSILARNTSWR